MRITITNGEYMESFYITAIDGGSTGALILEALEHGKVTVKGSTNYSSWTLASGTVYSRTWTNVWEDHNPGTRVFGSVTLSSPMDRREMVYVRDTVLTQALYTNAASVPAGCYAVDPGNNLYINTGDTTPATAPEEIDVAVLPYDIDNGSVASSAERHLVTLQYCNRIAWRGINVKHAATLIEGEALTFSRCSNVEVSDCTIYQNNGIGLGVLFKNITISNVRCVSNGRGGLGTGGEYSSDKGGQNIYVVDSEFSFNNWRGVILSNTPWTGWIMAGWKASTVRNILFERVACNSNAGRGHWFDTDVKNAVMRDCVAIGNHGGNVDDPSEYGGGYGLFVENNQGPIVLDNFTAIANTRGIFYECSDYLYISNSFIASNTDEQIDIDYRMRADAADWELSITGSNIWDSHLTIANSTIIANGLTKRVIDAGGSMSNWNIAIVLSNFVSVSNLFYNASESDAFFTSNSTTSNALDITYVSFDEWTNQIADASASGWGATAPVITLPTNDTFVTEGDVVDVVSSVRAIASFVTNVLLFDMKGVLLAADENAPYSFSWSPTAGRHKVFVGTALSGGDVLTSIPVRVLVEESPLVKGASGRVMYEYFIGVTNLLSNAAYPENPDGSSVLSSATHAGAFTNTFSARCAGYVVPTESGAYQFAVAGGDTVRLFMNVSNNNHMTTGLLAAATNTDVDSFSAASQVSSNITLERGKAYYFEVIVETTTSNGAFAFAWVTPGQSTPQSIPSSSLYAVSPYDLVSAPLAPTNVRANVKDNMHVRIEWDASKECDIASYALYRGTDASFTPSSNTLVADGITSNVYLDSSTLALTGYVYKVVALDYDGNVSDAFATETEVTTLPRYDYVGLTNATERVVNLETANAISFGTYTGVPGEKTISLRVFRLDGSTVKNVTRTAGETENTILWDFTSETGVRVSMGTYIYTLTIRQGETTTRKSGVFIVMQ